MTETIEIAYPKVTYNVAFLRHFIYVPSAGQQGNRYDVCFQGVDGNNMASAVKCFTINGLFPPLPPSTVCSLPCLCSMRPAIRRVCHSVGIWSR